MKEAREEKQRAEAVAAYSPPEHVVKGSSTPSASSTPTPDLSETSPTSPDPSDAPVRRGRIRPRSDPELSPTRLARIKEQIKNANAGKKGLETVTIDGLEFVEEPFEDSSKKDTAEESQELAQKAELNIAKQKERILGSHVMSPVCLLLERSA